MGPIKVYYKFNSSRDKEANALTIPTFEILISYHHKTSFKRRGDRNYWAFSKFPSRMGHVHGQIN